MLKSPLRDALTDIFEHACTGVANFRHISFTFRVKILLAQIYISDKTALVMCFLTRFNSSTQIILLPTIQKLSEIYQICRKVYGAKEHNDHDEGGKNDHRFIDKTSTNGKTRKILNILEQRGLTLLCVLKTFKNTEWLQTIHWCSCKNKL